MRFFFWWFTSTINIYKKFLKSKIKISTQLHKNKKETVSGQIWTDAILAMMFEKKNGQNIYAVALIQQWADAVLIRASISSSCMDLTPNDAHKKGVAKSYRDILESTIWNNYCHRHPKFLHNNSH